MAGQYDPLYLRGIEYFNRCEFFEAHEAWEELWADYQGPDRTFYQGLIQAAVCLHHFGNGNYRGARKLYYSSRKYLEAYLPTHQGLDVQLFLETMERCCRPIIDPNDPEPRGELIPELIPEIHLHPPADSTSEA